MYSCCDLHLLCPPLCSDPWPNVGPPVRPRSFVCSFLWIFSDSSDIDEVTKAIGKSLNSFISDIKAPQTGVHGSYGRDSPVTHLVYRWMALAKFQDKTLSPPETMAWLFLYIHQLVYEKTALMFPAQTGMNNKTSQQIQTLVNRDLKSLSEAKFGQNVLTKADRSNNKVNPLCLSLTFLEIYDILFEVDCICGETTQSRIPWHPGRTSYARHNGNSTTLCRSCLPQ